MSIPTSDTLTTSEKRFADGAQYRIEIPSTESPEAFKIAIDEADRIGCPVHRVSQGSGIQMLSDDQIREYSHIGADRGIEVCLFTMPRAGFDVGGMWNAPAGKFIQWQVRGADQLRYSIDEVKRACDLGIRSFLLADIGLIEMVSDLRNSGELPKNLIIKSSAVIAPANPASCKILERLGSDTINVATDLTLPQLSAIRSVTSAPIDMYVESPDGLGGFVRHHETPDMIKYASPLYIKLGLRNSPDIYPCGKHIESLAHNLTLERVRRSKLVYDLIQRQAPEAVMSVPGTSASDLGVPEVA
ncbi:U32 family peptidase [Pelagicoccus mobilis]|uniref:U32 family peptidase n=1 Tax=Pelagicoccus mobilis TaxID=415221 RepID=A0A934VRA0_9BACT|nr:U32 family peptidase [Pelagicoccus mobilis]MBK1879172.1 U32 family peptidase [Pelagicoccus mobilis]